MILTKWYTHLVWYQTSNKKWGRLNNLQHIFSSPKRNRVKPSTSIPSRSSPGRKTSRSFIENFPSHHWCYRASHPWFWMLRGSRSLWNSALPPMVFFVPFRAWPVRWAKIQELPKQQNIKLPRTLVMKHVMKHWKKYCCWQNWCGDHLRNRLPILPHVICMQLRLLASPIKCRIRPSMNHPYGPPAGRRHSRQRSRGPGGTIASLDSLPVNWNTVKWLTKKN